LATDTGAKLATVARADPAATDNRRAASEGRPKPARTIVVRSFRDPLKSGGNGPQMLLLPGGDFAMGSESTTPAFEERPRHPVRVRPFAISRHEVSFAEYDRFADATRLHRPVDQGWGRGQRPVMNVSWQDAVAYTQWLTQQTGRSYRLPTEAEWEYAARAGSLGRYWWGNLPRSGLANCFDCDAAAIGRSTTVVVGSYKANAFGLFDTSGNVEEWVQDCFHPDYQGAPADGSLWRGGDCTRRMVRGGSYRTPLQELRSTRRLSYPPGTRIDTLGFRVALSP
jgi:formylglycine-generating enzyme required for sulfatase activity